MTGIEQFDEDSTYSVPYRPRSRERHEWEDLFSDIPMAAQARTTRDGTELWSLAGGTLWLPQTAARIAQHAELVGMVHDPGRAKIRRALLAKGVHVWLDVAEPPLPTEVDRVDATAAALADAMPAEERRALAERLLDGLTDDEEDR